MKKASSKDIWRSIRNGRKRFFAILIITALGMAMLTGLYAACQDMYYSADQFFDEQHLFDVQVLSTLGLTDDDLNALAQVDGVETTDGIYSEQVFTKIDDTRHTADMTTLSEKDLNEPYLLEGALPANVNEIVVTQKYIDETGKSVGDTLSIQEKVDEKKEVKEEPAEDMLEEDELDADLDWDEKIEWEEEETPTFFADTYTITGVVLDPMDIKSDENEGFRSSAGSDFTFFVLPSAVSSDIYTSVFLSLVNTNGLNSFSVEYENYVQNMIDEIETRIKGQREQARYDSIIGEAKEKIVDAEDTMNEKFAEADEKFADGRKELADGKEELIDGEAELDREEKNAKEQLAEARKRIQDGKKELAEKRQQAEQEFANAENQLNEAQSELNEGRAQIESELPQLKSVFGNAWPEVEWNALVQAAEGLTEAGADDASIAQGVASESIALSNALTAHTNGIIANLEQQMNQLQIALDGLNQDPNATEEAKQQLIMAIAQLEENIAQLEALPASCVQAAIGLGKVDGGQKVLDVQKNEFEAKKQEAVAQIDDAEKQLADGEETLNQEEQKAQTKIRKARQDIADGKKELIEGEQELNQKEQEYKEKKLEAQGKISDGYSALDDIDMTKWYIQDRASLGSYSSMKSDMSSIEAVGNAFPIVFLVVAILISLTTMTRMVEEERGLIGTYKALGFRNADISKKYLIFAFFACLMGGIVGDVLGFVFMPQLVSRIFESLYTIPQFYLRFDVLYGIGGIVLFMIGIVGATALACRSELALLPAALMRPKAPRVGARVFLERIPAIWNKLKFLNKVTIRNLFRYKKRLIMTIAGIVGCTALVLCGFAIRDSVNALTPKQYGDIYNYDLMTVTDAKDHEEFLQQISGDRDIADYIEVQYSTIKVINSDEETETIQLMVIPDGTKLNEYINTPNLEGEEISLEADDVFVTRNVANILNLENNGSVGLQDSDLNQREVTISGIIQNYLGNTVYMQQGKYEQLFGAYEPNAVIAHLSDTVTDQPAYAKKLLENDLVISSMSTTAQIEEFSFDMINAVVILLIVMAGGLAFVVLFTLSNTNISERIRELATIKVLGFYDREVYQYVNKETLILTLIGIAIGLPVGRVLSGFLTSALNMPSLYFAVHVDVSSYLISAAISFGFALLVNMMTNRTLRRINMVEALKSVE